MYGILASVAIALAALAEGARASTALKDMLLDYNVPRGVVDQELKSIKVEDDHLITLRTVDGMLAF
jgi:hypothetical protein